MKDTEKMILEQDSAMIIYVMPNNKVIIRKNRNLVTRTELIKILEGLSQGDVIGATTENLTKKWYDNGR